MSVEFFRPRISDVNYLCFAIIVLTINSIVFSILLYLNSDKSKKFEKSKFQYYLEAGSFIVLPTLIFKPFMFD